MSTWQDVSTLRKSVVAQVVCVCVFYFIYQVTGPSLTSVNPN